MWNGPQMHFKNKTAEYEHTHAVLEARLSDVQMPHLRWVCLLLHVPPLSHIYTVRPLRLRSCCLGVDGECRGSSTSLPGMLMQLSRHLRADIFHRKGQRTTSKNSPPVNIFWWLQGATLTPNILCDSGSYSLQDSPPLCLAPTWSRYDSFLLRSLLLSHEAANHEHAADWFLKQSGSAVTSAHTHTVQIHTSVHENHPKMQTCMNNQLSNLATSSQFTFNLI